MLLFSQASLNRFTTPSGRIERIEALDAKPLMYYRWVERNAVVLCGAAGAGFWRVYLGGGSDALPVAEPSCGATRVIRSYSCPPSRPDQPDGGILL